MLEGLDEAQRQVKISQPESVEWTTTDGMFIKQMHIRNAGSFVPQHSHLYDHSSLLASGAVFLWKDGKLEGRFRAPHIIYIEKGVKHTFMSLTDDTVIYCLHAFHNGRAAEILEEHELSAEDFAP